MARSKDRSKDEPGNPADQAVAPRTQTEIEAKAKDDFLIVGVGASAGGLEALRQMFQEMESPEPGMAFVVVMHLAPDHVSHLAPILQNHTSMPVKQVVDMVKVEPNNVYAIPPGKMIALVDGHIQVSVPEEPRGHQASIDYFFRTLANVLHDRSAVVVLSGAGSDGAIGLTAVKEAGGITMAQDPAEAQYEQMPKASIATGCVDFVLPVAQIGARLMRYDRNRDLIDLPLPPDGPYTMPEAGGQPSAQGVSPAIILDALQEVLAFLRARTGHNFALYKRSTVVRRVERRMQVNDVSDLTDYLAFLRANPAEVQSLLNDLLISVTSFFRDAEVWKAVEANVIPNLFQGKSGPEHVVRVWVTACATGEEAYSVAMLLHEYASTLKNPPRIEVFATDLDEYAIAFAREGRYLETITLDVSPERISRFFTHSGKRYRVSKELRDTVLFAVHNLLKDPPFSRLDFVTCRNLLIYLNKDAQEQVLSMFHFALNPDAYLLLGTSEVADAMPSLFAGVNTSLRLYSRSAAPRHVPAIHLLHEQGSPTMPGVLKARESFVPAQPSAPKARENFAPAQPGVLKARGSFVPALELHQQMLEQYAPPSVVIDENYNISHLSARAGRYLHVASGEPTQNLVRMVAPALRLDLRNTLYQVAKSGKPAETRRLRVSLGGEERLVRILVRPVEEPRKTRGYSLVLFDEIEPGSENELGDPEGGTAAGNLDELLTRQLEDEVQILNSHLRVTTEQFETSLEDLRASNEELQAMNEELRSTTEELETSKEELQAVNEELLALNHELKFKIDEVVTANNDLENFITSTEIITIFLNRQLRVKRFTPGAEKLFNIIASDTDRPMSHITNSLNYPEMLDDVHLVLRHLRPVVREVQNKAGEWYMVRVLPYRTLEDHVEGVVLTFLDITERKHADEALRASEERFRHISESGLISLAFFTEAGEITDANDEFLRLMGLRRRDLEVGKLRWDTLTPPEWQEQTAQALEEFRRTGRIETYEKEYQRADGTCFWALFGAMRFSSSSEGVAFVVDITGRIEAEQELRRSQERFRAVADLVPDLIWSTDPQGKATWYNRRWSEFTGQEQDDVAGSEWIEVVHPDDRDEAAAHFAQAIKSGQPLRQEMRLRRRDGMYIWFLAQAEPVRDPQNRNVQWFGSFTDIHQQFIARQGLEEEVASRTAELEDLNAALAQERNRLRVLSVRLLEVQEIERRHLARELHDEIGQYLTGLKFMLDSIVSEGSGRAGVEGGDGKSGDGNVVFHERRVNDVRRNARLKDALATTAELTERVQQMALDLRPSMLDDFGLRPALLWMIERYTEQTGVHVNLEHSGLEKRLAPTVDTAVYRIVQEALTNAARHSGASEVRVQVASDSKLTLLIEDNGKGFDAAAAMSAHESTGLSGMHERVVLLGGRFTIDSTPGHGTTLLAEIPLEADEIENGDVRSEEQAN